MSTVAILGAGPIGSAIAHRLAGHEQVREVTLVDTNGPVAAGKALDIRQSGPIEGYDTRLSGTSDVLAAAGAAAIVIADDTAEGEWEGDKGLTLVSKLVRAGTAAPLVFAGPRQAWLMEAAARELKVPASRLVGSAASALAGIAASLVSIELGRTGVHLAILGRPPDVVVGWSAATVGGSLVTDVVPAHRLLAIEQTLQRLWPPGPQAIAAPTALIVAALISGSRHLHQAMAVFDDDPGSRGMATMAPLELGRGRVLGRGRPSLSQAERVRSLSTGRPA